jgi:hypothetical protein
MLQLANGIIIEGRYKNNLEDGDFIVTFKDGKKEVQKWGKGEKISVVKIGY